MRAHTDTQKSPSYRSVDTRLCDSEGDPVYRTRLCVQVILCSARFVLHNCSVVHRQSCVSVNLRLCSYISPVSLAWNAVWVNCRYVRETTFYKHVTFSTAARFSCSVPYPILRPSLHWRSFSWQHTVVWVSSRDAAPFLTILWYRLPVEHATVTVW